MIAKAARAQPWADGVCGMDINSSCLAAALEAARLPIVASVEEAEATMGRGAVILVSYRRAGVEDRRRKLRTGVSNGIETLA